jgi:branched-subunit amino acid permease
MGTGATTVDALSSLSDPIVGLVAAIGVITGTVTSGLMHKQTRRQIALDAAKAAVIVGFLGAIWYVGLGAIGEPTQSTVTDRPRRRRLRDSRRARSSSNP